VKQRTLKIEIHELERTTQNIKEELITDMESLRRKNQTEILEFKSPYSKMKITVEGHCCRPEQLEDRFLNLED
jgi:hypothetical protein